MHCAHLSEMPGTRPGMTAELDATDVENALKESVDKRRDFIRDAADLVRGLAIEFEIELGLRPPGIPVGEPFQLATPQRPLRQRNAPDRDVHAWRLPGDAAFLRDPFGRRDHAARDKALPTLGLAREQENRVAF